MPATERVNRAREVATAVIQWDPARNALKRSAHVYAKGRGIALERTGRLPEIAHLYAASSPKSGSQWMKALFSHPIVHEHSRLFCLPQLDYQSNPEKGFPPGTFVPGLYLSYPEYKRIPHEHAHRCIYMFRDPRDIVVSGYFSSIGYAHRDTQIPEIEAARQKMRELPQPEGLLFAVEQAAGRLQEMATWVGVEDPEVGLFRLEDVSKDPRTHVPRMLEHSGVHLSDDELEALLQDVSREALQSKDLARLKEGEESHYRVKRQTFRDLFTDDHYAAVEAAVPGLAAQLGYDT